MEGINEIAWRCLQQSLTYIKTLLHTYLKPQVTCSSNYWGHRSEARPPQSTLYAHTVLERDEKKFSCLSVWTFFFLKWFIVIVLPYYHFMKIPTSQENSQWLGFQSTVSVRDWRWYGKINTHLLNKKMHPKGLQLKAGSAYWERMWAVGACPYIVIQWLAARLQPQPELKGEWL